MDDDRLSVAAALDVCVGDVHHANGRRVWIQAVEGEGDFRRLDQQGFYDVGIHLHAAEAQVDEQEQDGCRAGLHLHTSTAPAPTGQQRRRQQAPEHQKAHENTGDQRWYDLGGEGEPQAGQCPQHPPVGQAERQEDQSQRQALHCERACLPPSPSQDRYASPGGDAKGAE